MKSPARIRRRSSSPDYSRRRRSPARTNRRSPVRRRYSPARSRSLRRGSNSPVRRRSSPVRRNLNRSRRTASSTSSSASSSVSSSTSSSRSASRSSSSASSPRSNSNKKNISPRIKDAGVVYSNKRENETNKSSAIKDDQSSRTNHANSSMNAIRIVNISMSIKKEHLKEIFSTFGEIKSVNLPLHERINLSKGYAYIEYETSSGAKSAYQAMNQGQIDGQFIGINLCDQDIIRKYEADSDSDIASRRTRNVSPQGRRSNNLNKDYRRDRSVDRSQQRSNATRVGGAISPRRTGNESVENRSKAGYRASASKSVSDDSVSGKKGRVLRRASLSSSSRSSRSSS